MAICLTHYEITTASGLNLQALRESLRSETSGLSQYQSAELSTWVGRVQTVDDRQDLGQWQSRNNALAATGLEQGEIKSHINRAIQSFGASKIGLVMASSTSSIDRTEEAYRNLNDGKLATRFIQSHVHNPHAPALFVAHYTGICGPAITINTACSSSAKVFATAHRWLNAKLVDAVLVGGVDSLCLSVLHGFDSLQLVSTKPCKPFDQGRDGINLGEAAGFALLVRPEDADTDQAVYLRGYGESSDAHHMSHPHPDGLGARLAMEDALKMAQMEAKDINYLNLHGTASRANDLIEGKLVSKMFPHTTLSSSTKGWTGHTLGAAGITECLIAADTIHNGWAPGTLNLEKIDDEIDSAILKSGCDHNITSVMSNSFGFGGNNCSIVFSAKEGSL